MQPGRAAWDTSFNCVGSRLLTAGSLVATGSRGAGHETTRVHPLPMWLQIGWRTSNLFAESGVCAQLPPVLRWWTSVSLAAFWKKLKKKKETMNPNWSSCFDYWDRLCARAPLMNMLLFSGRPSWRQPYSAAWLSAPQCCECRLNDVECEPPGVWHVWQLVWKVLLYGTCSEMVDIKKKWTSIIIRSLFSEVGEKNDTFTFCWHRKGICWHKGCPKQMWQLSFPLKWNANATTVGGGGGTWISASSLLSPWSLNVVPSQEMTCFPLCLQKKQESKIKFIILYYMNITYAQPNKPGGTKREKWQLKNNNSQLSVTYRKTLLIFSCLSVIKWDVCWGWRDGSGVKSTACCCRGPEFIF